MFKNKPPLADGQSIDTLIGPQVTLHGDLVFSGGLYVEGRVHGRIVAEEGTKAVLIVAEQGRIEGEVQVPVVVACCRAPSRRSARPPWIWAAKPAAVPAKPWALPSLRRPSGLPWAAARPSAARA